MVLFKRKHVQYVNTVDTKTLRGSTEVWLIEQTGEFFTEYEEYLRRRDFYCQKQFTCEISGHGGLTFFDALDSEMQESRELDSTFPEPLRGPVLKKVQFSTVSRLEHLVNWVYDEFKRDFFPKERVIASLENDDKAEGVVRDKVSFPARFRPDGTIETPGWSRYFLTLDSDTNTLEAHFEAASLGRDRRNFSKQILKSFLRDSLTKEAWHGAPWRVKDKLANQYRIETAVPQHLQYDTKVAEKKALAAQKRTTDAENKASFFDFLATKQKKLPTRDGQMLGVKIKSKGKNSRPNTHEFQVNHQQPNADPNHHGMQQVTRLPGNLQGMSPQQGPFSPIFVNGQLAYPVMPSFHPVVEVTPPPPMPPPPPPPPQVKFPTEDLDVPPRKDQARRPKFQFFAQEVPKTAGNVTTPPDNGLKMQSMGPLLDLWNTFNVHAEIFVLDSFTFDDFAEAMSFSADEVECELLNELFCSTLKQIVDDKGTINVTLPEFEEDESEDEEGDEEEEDGSPEAEPEPERRTTRSSFAKANEIKPKSPTPEDKKQHQAQELLEGRSWVDLLKERDFKDGTWHTIVVGILYQLSLDDKMKARCNRLLQNLVPLDDEVSSETATSAFKTLDVNDRIEILDILVKLTISSKTVRKHLEAMSIEMTKLRKNKVEHQSIRKKAIKELHRLDDERKPLLAAAQGSEVAAEVSEIQIEVKEEAPTNGAADSDDDGSTEDIARSMRRGGERASDRKRKRQEEAEERKRKAKKPAIAKLTKEEMALKKINDVIEKTKEEIREAEDGIADCNNDLRETDCQRTKCLGRDRFCNRYYWFERNGMPFGGLPNTSTADYGYANGRIWIQGPDAMEREGFIELPPQEQQLYKELHGMTVLDRKKEEEGPTHLNDATEWAYIDTPEALDQLIHWLDERGNREKPLRKELQLWRDVMVECMQKMRAHLDDVEAKKKGSVNGDGVPDTGTRVSTRTKTYVDLDSTQWMCLKWHNTQAEEHIGRLHSEGNIKKQKKGVAAKKDGKAVKAKGRR